MKITKTVIVWIIIGLSFSCLVPLGCERTHWNGDPKDSFWIEPWGFWLVIIGWLNTAACIYFAVLNASAPKEEEK